ncbi:metal ABC transporter solute-binding protein, Zn/Mn family [Halobacillus karajensis]|uniref:Zinc transport system zinc-binding lipoprotein AdcA n=1 Tax=Halobacillus karajensis TaxID=195088 RepID=A0A024P4U8_9BACI|nr:zinc ABC transporter substrate-binding protein [Halobacillus karajensis]CDQ20462.1 putative zinc transport system zinc-binding lipoprotein AdcA precursor [Halobacillus karajensis]CDQ24069.1 putative zinc transport system zinc-binding lipoprotein AdcA precursor [Halobacillus karajensis]CDQ27547.1 putative zinc transport system zinc-binding lipoprotein AdcA precursor [Halobacillus karajensis]
MKQLVIILSFIVIVSILTSCGNEETSVKQEKKGDQLTVYTTVYPLKFFTEQIGGDTVEVQSILPAGSDAHTYEPTTKEMVEMAEGDLFIYNGAGLEGYAKKISESIESEGVTILETASDIELKEQHHDHGAEAEHTHEDEQVHEDRQQNEKEDHEGHNHGEQDPHVWLDPMLAVQMAESIKGQLIELNPEHEQAYEKNFKELKDKLLALDQSFHKRIESKPKSKIIVSHAAYGYWEESYGINQIAVSGLSPTNEPSQKDLEEIMKVAEMNDLQYVIFEQNITPKVAEVIQNEIGAEALRFHNLAVLTEEDIKNKEDYFTLMERNLDVLAQALDE